MSPAPAWLRARFGHRAFLLKLLPADSVGAEIGVYRGRFSEQILQRVRPRELHLVDPWKHQQGEAYRKALFGGLALGGQAGMDACLERVRSRFAREIAAGRVVIHRGYSGDVIARFADQYFDWIYIDGNHLYDFVKQDLELAFRKTRSGGVVCGDDYMTGGWWKGEVKRAVDDFIRARNVEVLAIRNRQFALRR
jgi:hypothetical protein